MTISQTINRSWTFYKLHFRRLWPLYIVGSAGGFGIFNLIPNIGNVGKFVGVINPFLVVSMVTLFVACSLFIFLSHITLIKTISNTYKGHIQNVSDSYKVGEEMFFSALLVTVIYDLCVNAGAALLIIPGVILGIYLIFYLLEYVDQNKRGIDALLSSWAIVYGRWWEIFWFTLLVSFTLMALTIASVAILGVLGTILSAILGNTALSFLATFTVIGAIIFVGVFLVVIPMGIISLFEIYYHFRNSREHRRNHATDKKRTLVIKIFMVLGILLLLSGLVDVFI